MAGVVENTENALFREETSEKSIQSDKDRSTSEEKHKESEIEKGSDKLVDSPDTLPSEGESRLLSKPPEVTSPSLNDSEISQIADGVKGTSDGLNMRKTAVRTVGTSEAKGIAERINGAKETSDNLHMNEVDSSPFLNISEISQGTDGARGMSDGLDDLRRTSEETADETHKAKGTAGGNDGATEMSDNLHMVEAAERTSSHLEIIKLESDRGGEESEILRVAGQLKDLQSELNVDVLGQFEAFVRSRTRKSLDSHERNVSEGHSVSEQESDPVADDGGNGGNDSLQMAVELAIARKRRLLEAGTSISKVVEDCSSVKTDYGGTLHGVTPAGTAEFETTIVGEVKVVGGKRERSPEREESDGISKCAKFDSTLMQDLDGTVTELALKNVGDEVPDTLAERSCGPNKIEVEVREGEDVAIATGEGKEQDLVDADRVIETCRYSFSSAPVLLASARDEFLAKKNNFLKGCKWSPDGTCILTNSDDGVLRLFNLPTELYSPQARSPGQDLKAVLEMAEGELVYDYSWFPCMTSLSPETCCFASTSRGHPVHMWDAFTGQLRCSYRPHDHMDELISPHSLGFSLDGTKLYCGCNKLINVFDTNRPGKACEAKQTKGKLGGQTGIISCFAMSPDGSTYAAGSYSKSIGIYNDSCPSAITVLYGQTSGVTQLMYSIDGTKLYSGSRKDDKLLCWDVRRSNDVLFTLERNVKTNQRMYFDIDREDRFLVSGNQDGAVTVWDLTQPPCPSADYSSYPVLEPLTKFMAHKDATNGISIHPWLPLMATASGQRVVPPPTSFGSDGESEEDGDIQDCNKSGDNSLKIWSLENRTAT